MNDFDSERVLSGMGLKCYIGLLVLLPGKLLPWRQGSAGCNLLAVDPGGGYVFSGDKEDGMASGFGKRERGAICDVLFGLFDIGELFSVGGCDPFRIGFANSCFFPGLIANPFGTPIFLTH